MKIFSPFVRGACSVLRMVGESCLFYGYQNSATALRGDWVRIGNDIRRVIAQLKKEREHG